MSRTEQLKRLQHKRRAAINVRDEIADNPANQITDAGPNQPPFTPEACRALRQSWRRILTLDREINTLFLASTYPNGTLRSTLH